MKLTDLIYQIEEKRAGGDINKKTNPHEELFKHKDRDDLYISFTTIPKIGINPKSGFNTPLGIYCYPYKKSIDKYGYSEYTKRVQFPYASTHPYIYVLKRKSGIKIMDSAYYNDTDLINDLEKLRKFFSNKFPSGFLDDCYKASFVDALKTELPMGRMWYILYVIHKNLFGKLSVQWNLILRKVLEYDLVEDTYGIIHSNEPCQAFFTDSHGFDVIAYFRNVTPNDPRDYINRIVEISLTYIKNKIKVKENIDRLLSLTRKYNINKSEQDYQNIMSALLYFVDIKDFPYLLSKVGYDDFVTYIVGNGLLHDEFSSKKLELIAYEILKDKNKDKLYFVLQTKIPIKLILKYFDKEFLKKFFEGGGKNYFSLDRNNYRDLSMFKYILGDDIGGYFNSSSFIKTVFDIDIKQIPKKYRNEEKITSIFDVVNRSIFDFYFDAQRFVETLFDSTFYMDYNVIYNVINFFGKLNYNQILELMSYYKKYMNWYKSPKYSDLILGSLSKLLDKKTSIAEEKKNIETTDINKVFDLFNMSYTKATGNSWNKEKFLKRAQNWTFFGDASGYVTVRPQQSGLIKLVGVAGSPKSIIKGFKELIEFYRDKPVWGSVSLEIGKMIEKLDPNFKMLKLPVGMAGKIIFNSIVKSIPSSVFGGASIEGFNSDGTIKIGYKDIGETNKVLIGNKEYFDFLKSKIVYTEMPDFVKNFILKNL